MRWVTVAAILLLPGCASSPDAESDISYETRIDELLKSRPDDADLLFLRHDHKDLARCNRLAELRPTPIVLASIVSNYLSVGLEEENLPDFERQIAVWKERDPVNAMPVILQGLIRISRGNLSAGVETVLRATELPALRMYSLEAQQEDLRIQKQEGLEDVYFLGAVLRDKIQLSRTILGVSRLLRAMETWESLDGNREGAFRTAAANYRLTRLFERDARSYLEGLILSLLTPYSAERMCELALMARDSASAVQYAAIAREGWLAHKARSIASKRYTLSDPVIKAMQDAGMFETTGNSTRTEAVDELLGRFLDSMKNWDQYKDRFQQILEERKDVVRKHLDAQVRRGYLASAAELLTKEDRESLKSLGPPIDRFMEMKGDFYPAAYGPAHRNRLIEFLTAEGPEEESEVRELLKERAANALIFQRDKGAIPFLRECENIQAVIVIVALGGKVDSVGGGLMELAEACNPSSSWVVARLRITEQIPDYLLSLYTNTGPLNLVYGFADLVTAYFALRELTGQQFGFDADRWVDWGRKEGYWKD
jgi:hypothetical protein